MEARICSGLKYFIYGPYLFVGNNMNEAELIKTFREMCKIECSDGHMLPPDCSINVPVFVESNHSAEFPQIIITPFVSRRQGAKTTMLCGEEGAEKRVSFKHNYTRFQVDIYSKKIIELMQIKTMLLRRLENFMEVEIIVYKEDLGWEAYGPNVYLNDDYDEARQIAKLTDPLSTLEKVESAEEVAETNGSWFLDETGLYVNPLIDMDSISIYEILNGKTFDNGDTAYDRGIQTLAMINERKLADEAPSVERWSMDLMITYRETNELNFGSPIEELRVYDEKK